MEKVIKCPICDLICASIKCYYLHNRIHRHEKLFQCPLDDCHKKFGSYASFGKHIRFCHEGPPSVPKKSSRVFKCSLATCDFEERVFEKIMKHAADHINTGQPVYCALQCPTRKPFATYSSLKLHKFYAHRGGFQKSSVCLHPKIEPGYQEENSVNEEHAKFIE